MHRFLVFSLFAVALAGCATQPVATSQTQQVSSNAVLAPEFSAPTPGAGALVIKRDKGLTGSACTYRVYVNGSPAVDLRAAQSHQLFLPAGTHIIGARPASLCGGGTSEAQVAIRQGSTITYRLAATQMGDIVLQPTAF